MSRLQHCVGSFPEEIVRQGDVAVMRHLLDRIDKDQLTTVVCDRDSRWIIQYLDELARKEAFRSIRTGDSSDYDHMPIYRPTRKLTALDVVDLDREDAISEILEAHSSLGPDVPPLQLSLPNPLDLALFTFVGKPTWKHPIRTARGAWLALRNLRTFEQAMSEMVHEARTMPGGKEIVWQLETPAVLFALNLVPKWLRYPVARWLATQVGWLLQVLPERTILHLCYGDLANTEVVAPKDMSAVALFLQELGRVIPRDYRPRVHIPVAFGNHPPSTEAAHYAPLSTLGVDWKLIAGVVDEHNPDQSRLAIHLFEDALGYPAYAVATACGLGRHSVEDADLALKTMGVVATA